MYSTMKYLNQARVQEEEAPVFFDKYLYKFGTKLTKRIKKTLTKWHKSSKRKKTLDSRGRGAMGLPPYPDHDYYVNILRH